MGRQSAGAEEGTAVGHTIPDSHPRRSTMPRMAAAAESGSVLGGICVMGITSTPRRERSDMQSWSVFQEMMPVLLMTRVSLEMRESH